MRKVLKTTLAISCLVGITAATYAAKPTESETDRHQHSFNLAEKREPKSHAHIHNDIRVNAAKPHFRTTRPPDEMTLKFDLPSTEEFTPNKSSALTANKVGSATSAQGATAECKDINGFLSRSGTALADYIAALPDVECTYGLFSVSGTNASTIYSNSNVMALADRLVQLAPNYNASSRDVGNIILYLRAGYYLAAGGTVTAPSATVTNRVVNGMDLLIANARLFDHNSLTSSTAKELMILITNMKLEDRFLPGMKTIVQRYTNSSANPNAVDGIRNSSASGGFTGVLTVYYRAQWNDAAKPALESDSSHPTALHNFVMNNRTALEGGSYAYQLTDAANEAFRFMQYAGQKNTVKPMIQTTLNQTSLTGAGADLWLAAASSVKYYDYANCAQYGVCNLEQTVANAVLTISHQCSSTIRMRVQHMSASELQASCTLMAEGEIYFHRMMQTNNQPVAQDNNSQLEVVVFDDYTNYNRYAGVIYDIGTDNGGMYLEGNPATIGNQARFIAHEASWLRPAFKVWNLEHEYVHYLDGRFNLHGDFAATVAKPTVWWLEGLGEYLSLKNNNQAAIDAAKTGTYTLSTIFNNNYSMSDYTARAYRWGYMAVRFMNERHRADIDAILPKMRSGDYAGYWNYMQNTIGNRYDSEFASWAQTASTAGYPPLPTPGNIDIALTSGVAVTSAAAKSEFKYFFIDIPANSAQLKIEISGGTGDADLYVKRGSKPTLTSFDQRPYRTGNSETVTINNPTVERYYIGLHAYAAFSGVSLKATLTTNTGGGTGTPCGSATRLENGCTISNLNSSANAYISLWVPAGAKNLVISTSGGTGNANLFVKAGGWPSTSDYHWASTNTGNAETVSVASPNGGQWFYITLNAASAFNGVNISASFTP